MHRRTFAATRLSRENVVLPAQLATAGEPADNLVRGVDMLDGTASRCGVSA